MNHMEPSLEQRLLKALIHSEALPLLLQLDLPASARACRDGNLVRRALFVCWVIRMISAHTELKFHTV